MLSGFIINDKRTSVFCLFLNIPSELLPYIYPVIDDQLFFTFTPEIIHIQKET